ncbi:MAG: hypothetical protein ACR2PY_01545, partial [Salinispira sp.]
ADGVYLREEIMRGSARKISIIGQSTDEDEEEEEEEEERWLVFERQVTVPDTSESVRVEVSFHLGTEEDKFRKSSERIMRIVKSPLIVYFPTEKETRFGFLIQGPYRTTPARDNIPKNDEWNETLVKETAALADNVLSEMKELGLLSVSFLEVLPIRMEDFSDDDMFYPIVESIMTTLTENELLPADNGSFVSPANARLARGAELQQLLTQDQLTQLFQSQATLQWLSKEITENGKRDLYRYLTDELEVTEVTSELFARSISQSFLSEQPDEWFVSFYKYLHSHDSLWKILRSKPIIRLDTGEQVIPFISDGRTPNEPNAFLPPPLPEETDYPIVKRSIADDEHARAFLKKLGLSEFNVFDDIVRKILPKYTNDDGYSIPDAEHHSDIHKILHAMRTRPQDERINIRSKALKTPFLKAINVSGDRAFEAPKNIYLNTPELRQYFSIATEVWFLHDEYASFSIDDNIWLDLGISKLPRKLSKQIQKETREISPQRWKELKSRGLTDEAQRSTKPLIIKTYYLEGLKQFLESIHDITNFDEQKKLAFVLWGFLQCHVEHDPHFFKATCEWYYHRSRVETISSMILVRLKNANWIPTKNGSLEKPGNISADQLLEEFLGATELIEILEIVDSTDQREFEKNLGFSPQEITEYRDNRAEFRKFMAARNARPDFPTRPVKNPERRKERIGKQLSNAPAKKYDKRTRIVRISAPDNDPKTWLRNQYTNEDDQMVCQICKNEMPFRKNDGQHYFEKKELLSKSHLPKEHNAQYLALCPLCAAKYTEFIIPSDAAMNELKEAIISRENCEIPISLNKEEISIRFVETHYQDIKTILNDLANDRNN